MIEKINGSARLLGDVEAGFLVAVVLEGNFTEIKERLQAVESINIYNVLPQYEDANAIVHVFFKASSEDMARVKATLTALELQYIVS